MWSVDEKHQDHLYQLTVIAVTSDFLWFPTVHFQYLFPCPPMGFGMFVTILACSYSILFHCSHGAMSLFVKANAFSACQCGVVICSSQFWNMS